MAIDELPSGAFRVRLTVDGIRYAETFPTRQQAQDWEMVTRAKAVTGSLPSHVTVEAYAARWIRTYDTKPVNTRIFHTRNLRVVTAALGSSQVAKVVPTDITVMLNRGIGTKGVAYAARVYRTTSALFGSAHADGLCPNGSPVRSKRHRPRRQPEPHIVLERTQARAVLLQLGGWQRDTALLQLALGARFGEIAGLTPHDVDLTSGRIAIRRRFSSHAGTVRATKNHRYRLLDVPQIARSTLQRLVQEAGSPPPLPDLEDREWDAAPFRRRWLIQTATGRPSCNSPSTRSSSSPAAPPRLPSCPPTGCGTPTSAG